ncbi:DNA repair protein RecO [Bacillaceae bacterium W0354]
MFSESKGMGMFEKVNGIIVRTRDYGETNKIVTLYTREYGLLSAVARGAKKPKSRMAAITQPFIYGLFLIQLGKGLGTIHQGEIEHSMRKIREDIIKTAYAAYICELLTKVVQEKEPNPSLFDELFTSLERMQDEERIDVISMMFELKLYRVGGFAPIINHCVNGHEERPVVGFSITEGGVICDQCKWKTTDVIPINHNTYKVLRIMCERSIKNIRQISIKKETVVFLRKLLDDYYEQYGGAMLKSKRFLEQLHLLSEE